MLSKREGGSPGIMYTCGGGVHVLLVLSYSSGNFPVFRVPFPVQVIEEAVEEGSPIVLISGTHSEMANAVVSNTLMQVRVCMFWVSMERHPSFPAPTFVVPDASSSEESCVASDCCLEMKAWMLFRRIKQREKQQINRVGQNRIYALYMTVCMVISLQKYHLYTVYIWFCPTLQIKHPRSIV